MSCQNHHIFFKKKHKLGDHHITQIRRHIVPSYKKSVQKKINIQYIVVVRRLIVRCIILFKVRNMSIGQVTSLIVDCCCECYSKKKVESLHPYCIIITSFIDSFSSHTLQIALVLLPL